jgi:uncharacterized membrane protein
MPNGMNYSTAAAFTPRGDIVGSVWNDKGDAQGGVWNQKSKAFASLSSPKGYAMTAAMGVAGEAIIGCSRDASSKIFVPTVWKNGTPTVLPIPEKYLGAATTGNAKGEIIGTIYDSKTLSGVIWLNGKMQTLDSLGSIWTIPQAINTKGEVVGYVLLDKNYHALYWSSPSAKPVDLSPNADRAVALDNNSQGQIVGYVGKDKPVATLWQDGKSIDLNTLLPKNSGWVLRTAKTISDDGKIIVGVGEYKNKILAYLLRL